MHRSLPGLPQITAWENVLDITGSECRVRRILLLQRRNSVEKLIPTGERIADAVPVGCDDLVDVAAAAVREIVDVKTGRLLGGRGQEGIQSRIAKHQLLVRRIDRDSFNAVPPSARFLDSEPVGALNESAVLVVKYPYRHPFPDDNQVLLTVAVVVKPRCRCNHSCFRQSGRFFSGDVRKTTMSIVLQEMTLGSQSVCARYYPAPEEYIGIAVAVEVTNADTGPVLENVRNGVAGTLEIPAAVVEIQSGTQRIFVPPEFIAAAGNEQIDIAVAVCIEENRAHILRHTVGGDRWLLARLKGAIALLHEKLSGLPLRPADVEVIESIPVDVTNR